MNFIMLQSKFLRNNIYLVSDFWWGVLKNVIFLLGGKAYVELE